STPSSSSSSASRCSDRGSGSISSTGRRLSARAVDRPGAIRSCPRRPGTQVPGSGRTVRSGCATLAVGSQGAVRTRTRGARMQIGLSPEQEAFRAELRAYYDEVLDDDTMEEVRHGNSIGETSK